MKLVYFSFFLISCWLATVTSRKCYSCGYIRKDGQESTEIPDTPMCSDDASMEDNLGECSDENECCASLKEYIIEVDEETGENSTTIIGRHACESDLEHLAEFNAICSEHKNECYHVDQSTLGNHHHDNVTITDAEVCFCDTDRCNTMDPVPPIDDTTPKGDSTPNPGPSKECYACGYLAKWEDGDMGQIEEVDGVPFCKDVPNLGSVTKQCGNGDDCCGSVREYMIRDEDGKHVEVMIARHDCESDLKHLANEDLICDKNTYGCFNISKENIVNQDATFAEACFCEGDRCNNNMPELPNPDLTTTTPSNPDMTTTTTSRPDDMTTTTSSPAASFLTFTSSVLTFVVALIVLHR